jgi:hypothetical protein
MKELLDLLENCSNVKQLTYDTASKNWTVVYFNGQPDEFDSETLLDFLENG